MSVSGAVSVSGGRSAREAAWHAYVRRCAEGDQSALGGLYDESSQYVYGVVLSVLRDTPDAEEVTLDVYSQVWRSAAVYSSQRGSVVAWLLTLARSRAIDKLRSRASRRKREESIEDAPNHSFETGEASPEASASASETRQRIQYALSRLPVDQREAVELAYFSGMSHSELAAHLGQPLGTVKTRIRMGMMKLREELQGHSL
jgi:RNA polymerase sigma-70 factor (ECF subfamily)